MIFNVVKPMYKAAPNDPKHRFDVSFERVGTIDAANAFMAIALAKAKGFAHPIVEPKD